MGNFKIDTDAFSKAIKEYETQLTNLDTIKNNISNTLRALKEEGWNSKAGEACMKKFDDQWAKEIEKYISLVKFLEDVLKEVQPGIENLIKEANSLHSID